MLGLLAMRQRIRALQEDPAALERVAREDLGLVRPDEVVLVLPPTAEPHAPAPAE